MTVKISKHCLADHFINGSVGANNRGSDKKTLNCVANTKNMQNISIWIWPHSLAFKSVANNAGRIQGYFKWSDLERSVA